MADASGDNWSELTSGEAAAVRLAAPDLQQARRARGWIADDVAVILDITVAVAADFRSARAAMPWVDDGTLHYAGPDQPPPTARRRGLNDYASSSPASLRSMLALVAAGSANIPSSSTRARA